MNNIPHPDTMPLLQLKAALNIAAAAVEPGGSAMPARFDILAYNGGALRLNSWSDPVVIDLAGMSWPSDQNIKVLIDHNYVPGAVAGNTSKITSNGKELSVAGILYNTCDEFVAKVVEKAKLGLKWEASIGAVPVRKELLAAGKTAVVNGQTVTGPATIARESKLIECSIVVFGADPDTQMNIAARKSDGGNNSPKIIILY